MAIDVSKQIAKAETAFKSRKYDLAVEIYLQALQIDPDNRAGRRGVRIASLKKHEHSYPSKIAIKVGTAGARTGMLNPSLERRLPSYENYLKVDPRNTGVAYKLAEALEKAGYLNGAIGVYEALVSHAPKEEAAYVNLGRLLGPKDPESAIDHLERALQVNPKNQQAIKLRKDLAAELSIKRTGFETAKTTHDLLRDKDQASRLLQQDRIQRVGSEAGDYVSQLEADAEASPEDKHVLRKLAMAYSQSQRWSDAEQAWGRVIEVDPTDFDARVKLGDLRINAAQRQYQEVKRAGDAEGIKAAARLVRTTRVAEFRSRVAEHPTDLGLRFQLGQALLALGEVDDAIAEFQQAVKDPRKRFDSLGLLGECFLRKKLYDLAARQLTKALEESPGLNSEQGKRVVYNLGLLRERQGNVAQAREHFLEIYEVDVGYRDVSKKVMELSG